MRFYEELKARGSALVCLLLIAAMLCSSALAATYPFNGVINADTNMRSAPRSNESNVIRRILKGESVIVVGATGNFYRIEFDGKTGYVFKKYVERGTGDVVSGGSTGSVGSTDSGTGQGLYKTVATAAVNMRASASTNGRVIITVPEGATVTVNAIQGDWVNVTYSGKTGWCYGAYIHQMTVPTAAPAGPTAEPEQNAGSFQVLQSGADGNHVMALQEALIELGYLRGTADGVYGSATAQAVMALQRANDYPITGIADANLQAFIFNGKPIDSTGNKLKIKTLPYITGLSVCYGDQGLLVRTIQSHLEKQGLLTNNVTGTYDRATEAAVKAFQKQNGLTADGVCGADTQRLLLSGGASSNPAATPTPAPTPLPTFQIPTRTVRKGSTGENAVLVQQRLIELGYMDGPADGKFGSGSVAALKAFQTKNGLKADGVAGEDTFEVLFSHVALGVHYVPLATPAPTADVTVGTYPPITRDNVVTIRLGVKGDAVERLQQRLTELGYYNSNLDGICKADDVAAIRAFQRMNGLTVDGVAGYGTQSILYLNTAIRDDGLMAGAVQTTYTPLKKGMKGDEVKYLQERLITLGYLTQAADGVYGTDTAEAVYNFQKQNNLVRDGVAGEKTLKALYSTTAVKAPTTVATPPATIENAIVRQGDTGDLVTSLQEKLIRLGYLAGKADGVFGERTYRALKMFQRDNALYADGIAGEKTFAALNIAGTGNNGAIGSIGGSTAPTVTTKPDEDPGVSVPGTTVAVSAKNVVYEYWYSTVRAACRKYPYATVYDYQTGISWQVHMFSYGKHAEAEPLTAADTAAMEKACGGNKWTPRPVWVIFADGTIRIATTHSVPHEVQHITDNNFPGHTCIHFPRTQAQVTAIGPYATSHQKAVDKAWAAMQATLRN